MTYEIITISSNTMSDGSFSVSGVLWLVAPANLVIPIPGIKSIVPNITAAQLSLLQNGTIVEVAFNSGLYSQGTVLADVQTDLQNQFNIAQTNLNNSAPVSNGFVGIAFDGYSWTTPNTPLNFQSQAVLLAGVPVASDGRPNILPTLFPSTVQLTIIGAGDSSNGNGTGTAFTSVSNDLFLTNHTVSWTFNDYIYLAGGQIVYTGAVIGDYVDYWIVAPANTVTTVSGTGNVSLTGPGNVLIIPGTNTNSSVNLSTAIPVPNTTNTGFWDWTPTANGKGAGTITPNLTRQGGYDLYTISINLTHPVTAFQLNNAVNGSNCIDLIIPALIPRKVLPQWQHNVIVTNSGHVGLSVSWTLTIARVSNT